MDIEDVDEEPSSSTANVKSSAVDSSTFKSKSKELFAKNDKNDNHPKKENHHRSETVQQADAAMKIALKPYFL